MSDHLKISGRCQQCDKPYGECQCHRLTIEDFKSFSFEGSGLFARMPKSNPGGHHDWLSRDHADIDCQATGCQFNKQKKCGVPSICKINDKGGCDGFISRPLPPKIDGD